MDEVNNDAVANNDENNEEGTATPAEGGEAAAPAGDTEESAE